MLVIKAELDDHEREFELLGTGIDSRWDRGSATHMISPVFGEIIPATHNLQAQNCTYLHLISPRHTFGGVVFEETGERRIAKAGEWFLDNPGDKSGLHKPTMYPSRSSAGRWPIIRPVALEAL